MTTQNSPFTSDETLDIKRIVTSLVSRWWIIAGSLAGLLALAAIFSYVIQTPVYEASGSFTLPEADTENKLGLTPAGYLALASSTPVMESVEERVNLGLNASQLRNRFAFEIIPDRTLTFTASADSADTAFSLADTWITSYQEEVERLVKDRVDQLEGSHRQQIELLLPQMTSAETDLQLFNLEHPPGQLDQELAGLEVRLSKSVNRLHDLTLSDIPRVEAKLAKFQTSGEQELGVSGGGGAPTRSETNGGAPNILVPVESGLLSTDLAYIEQIQNLTRSQIFNWESDLVNSENRLRTLEFSSIPILESRVASLEEAVALEPEFLRPPPETTGEGSATISNPVHFHLRQQLSDARVQLAFERREAEVLSEKIGVLRDQIAALRQDLLIRQEYDKARATLALNLDEARRLEIEIPKLRAANTDFRERIIEEGAARQKLESAAAQFETEYLPAKTELERLVGMESQLESYTSLSALQEPSLPTNLVSPQRGRNMGIAIFIGLFLGVSIALLVDYYPGRFNSSPTARP